ncbi:Mucin-2 [Xylographa soralifera]|nr:Mucin-2 [Xylographa soralifera]
MAQQRFASISLLYVIAILSYWHTLPQALALPARANVGAEFLNTAPTSPSPRATSTTSAVISNGNTTPSTRQLTLPTASSDLRNLSSPPDLSSRISKFARSQTVSSLAQADLISTAGSATRTQPAHQPPSTSALPPSQPSPTSYPTTLRTISTPPPIATASTPPSTLSASPSASTSTSITTSSTPLPPSLLIPLLLVLTIILLLLALLIRSSRPTSTSTSTPPPPRPAPIPAAGLREVPSTESTVVTCREIYELQGSMPCGWGGRWGGGMKELDAGGWG